MSTRNPTAADKAIVVGFRATAGRCCSLVADAPTVLETLENGYHPDRDAPPLKRRSRS